MACLKWFNRVVFCACILIPPTGQTFIWVTKVRGVELAEKTFLSHLFTAILMLAGAFQIFFALLLFYSMLTIYIILRKNGLQDKINICSFIINSLLFLF